MLVFAKDIPRPTIRKALRSGDILRVHRGVYVYTRESRFGKVPPNTDAIVYAYAAWKQIAVARHPAWEANRLGLSRQVPARPVWLTSGPSTVLMCGNLRIALTQCPDPTLLLDPHGLAGALIRALEFALDRG